MRIYSSVLEAIKEIEREIFEMGIDNHAPSVQDINVKDNLDYDSKELPGYAYMLTKFDDIDSILGYFFKEEELRSIRDYCSQELKDRKSTWPKNPGNSWYHRENYWRQFLKGNKFAYTYSERMWHQLPLVVEELRKSKGSRQCIITIYDTCKDLMNMGGKARIPCSLYYQFLRREISGKEKLMMIYTMRSCDFYTHFCVDVWLAIKLGVEVAQRLDLELYNFTHFIGSLHAFAKDYNKRRIF